MEQFKRVIEKSQKPKEKFEVNDSISEYFNDAEEFLNGRYLEEMENEKEELKEIENEYIFSLIFDQLNEGKSPKQFEFYFGGNNRNFFLRCAIFGLNSDNEKFVDFLSSYFGKKIMTENKISIHVKMGNLYSDNMNTNESLYDFVMPQQDVKKTLINSFFSYGGDFLSYLTGVLMGIDSEADNKFDMLTNKNIKYHLFY